MSRWRPGTPQANARYTTVRHHDLNDLLVAVAIVDAIAAPCKRRSRAHYAALVTQIDDEFGTIVTALRETGQVDNTVIIFASDHGNYLGDHNLIGKGHFYELLSRAVSRPGAAGGVVCDDLVALTDMTATLLALGGVELSPHLHARPLPGLGIAGAAGRDHLIGALHNGWMVQQDQWRPAKYATGEQVLFDLTDDAHGQRNRLDDPAVADVRHDLDGRLTAAVMGLMVELHFAQRVYVQDLSASEIFGRAGWQRAYPRAPADR